MVEEESDSLGRNLDRLLPLWGEPVTRLQIERARARFVEAADAAPSQPGRVRRPHNHMSFWTLAGAIACCAGVLALAVLGPSAGTGRESSSGGNVARPVPQEPPSDKVERLLYELSADDPARRDAAVAGLLAAGDNARTALEGAVRSSDPERAGRAREILARLDRQKAVTLFRERMPKVYEGILSLPKVYGKRRYKIDAKGQNVVEESVLRAYEVEGDIVLEAVELWLKEKFPHRYEYHCASDGLLPLRKYRYEWYDGGGGPFGREYAVVAGRTLSVPTGPGKVLSFGFPEDAVCENVLPWLIPLLPQDKGFALKFTSYHFHLERGAVFEPGRVLECQGEELITVADRDVRATKWADVAAEVSPHSRTRSAFWVKDGILLKALLKEPTSVRAIEMLLME